jgi:hypothetical protein
MEKRNYLPVMFSETDIDVMHAIWRQIDPLLLSNRGKFFPESLLPSPDLNWDADQRG